MSTQFQPQSGDPQDHGEAGSRASPPSIFGKPSERSEEITLSENVDLTSSARHHVITGVNSPFSEDSLNWEKIANTLPSGLIVFDSKQEVLFGNQTYLDLLGYDILECDGVEDWIAKMCPDSSHREKVISSWRRHVWRKQSTQTYTLKNKAGKSREIEFRASVQSDGGLVLMLQDVTLAKRTEEAVRLGKLKFRVLFSNLKDGVVLVDKSGRILDINQSFLKFLDIPLSELRLTLLSDLLHPDDARHLIQDEESILSKESLSADDKLHRDIRIQTKTGEKRAKLAFCPVVAHGGDYTMGTYIFHEPEPETPVEDAAKKIKGLVDKAQALLNAVPDLILLINRDKIIADFAPPAKPWKELPVSDSWIGKSIGENWTTLGELLDQTHERVFDQKKSIHADLPSTKDDEGAFVVTLAPCGEDQAMAVVQNVSEITTLRESRRWHQTLFAHSKDSVIRTDENGIVQKVNEAGSQLLGKPANELVGMRLSQLYSETSQLAKTFEEKLAEELTTKQGWLSDLTLYSPAGGQQEVSSLIVPVEDDDGDPQHLLNIISQKEQPVAEKNTSKNERSQHQIRNQIQLITSLFALEAQSTAGKIAGLKWQVRLRSLAQSYPYSDDGNIWVLSMIRSLADEISSLSGRGPACREIVITGPENLIISAEIATPFSLLIGEIMRMVISSAQKSPGPKLFLELERCAHGEISLNVKPGSSGQLFSPTQQAEAGTLEILAQQIRGKLRASLNSDNVGSLQIVFDGQVS